MNRTQILASLWSAALLSISATCYLTMVSTAAGSWCIFIWAIPLFLNAVTTQDGARWQWGALWSTCVMGAQSSGFLWGICMLASGACHYRLIVPTICLIGCAILGALWFHLANRLSSPQMVPYTLVCWTTATWLYLMAITYCCPPLQPLVPIVEYAPGCAPLLQIGTPLLLLAILSLQAACVYLVVIRSCVCGMIIIALLVGAGIYGITPYAPPYASQFGVLTCSYMSNNATETLHLLAAHCTQLRTTHPELACILLPESSLYDPKFFDPWYTTVGYQQLDAQAFAGITLVVGGFCTCTTVQRTKAQNNDCYNTAWLLGNGHLLDRFHKHHTMSVSESLPAWIRQAHHASAQWSISMQWLYDLYFTNRHYIITDQTTCRPVWQLFPGCYVVPYICSELFFAQRPHDAHRDVPILALCNSAWVPPYARWMMARFVQFRAIEWGRTILYVAHAYSGIYYADGTYTVLRAEPDHT